MNEAAIIETISVDLVAIFLCCVVVSEEKDVDNCGGCGSIRLKTKHRNGY